MLSKHTTPNKLNQTYAVESRRSDGNKQLQSDNEQYLQIIAALREENKKLKAEIEDSNACHDEIQKQFSAQSEHMFRKAAEMQAEIDKLKANMRTQQCTCLQNSSEKFSSRRLPDVSDPPLDSKAGMNGANSRSKPRPQNLPGDEFLNLQNSADSKHTGKSHQNSPWTNLAALSTSESSVLPDTRSRPVESRKRKSNEDTTTDIAAITEDGEELDDQSCSVPDRRRMPNSKKLISSRLDALMSTPASKAVQISSKPFTTHVNRRPQPHPGVDMHDSLKSTTVSHHWISKPDISSSLPLGAQSARLELLNRKTQGFGHQSLSDLAAPGFDSKLDATNRDFEYQSQSRRVSANSSSSRFKTATDKCQPRASPPSMDLKGKQDNLSDNKLLVQFLGSGSEARITQLTRSARINLLHEAKTKLIADEYKILRKSQNRRRQSPAGFWQTDMFESE